MKNWYQIKAQANKRADVYIYDYIGDYGVEAKSFVMELQALDVEQINLRINSPGGSLTDGFTIYNAICRHNATVTTHIDGLAASMASIIALAADKVIMAENAFYMIHNPWTVAIGDKNQLNQSIELLDKMGKLMVNIYSEKSGIDPNQVQELMDAETWLTGTEALEQGFVDEVSESIELAACVKADTYKNTPQTLIKPPENSAVNALQLHKLALKRSLL
ncbi:head maturation protease, ClpP-related [Piscirickettsia salmonis]|uniref:head maturation protease, ClpP-related n=1 Tax=Piscirickettsia salmonis TaxID=1238 RepID=UPI0007C970C9|nr:ATP-dependent Clp protease proteolytic subunit [Piscirickettsiaceae bacterium NZ-RLO1]